MTFYLTLQENLDISNFEGAVPIFHANWTHQTHDEVSIRIGVVTGYRISWRMEESY